MDMFTKSAWTAAGDPLEPEYLRLPRSQRRRIQELARAWRVSTAEAARRLLAAGLDREQPGADDAA